MPAIYLLRHGQASFGAEDYDVLSDLGARQALVAGHELARRGARSPVVASGSLRRQRDTATIAAAALGVPTADIDTRWNEMHAHELVDDRLGAPGASAGLTSTEFQGRLDEAMAQWIDSGDPAWHAFSDGALQALTDLAAAIPRGRDAVVVTSSGGTAAVCGRLLGATSGGVIALNRVSINASITTITASPRGLSLVAFNDHGHFLADRTLLTNR